MAVDDLFETNNLGYDFLPKYIGVAPKKKVVRPIFFVRRGLSPIFFLGICTKINSCAFSAK